MEQRIQILIAGGRVAPMCVGLNCSCCTQFASVNIFQSSELLWASPPEVCHLPLPHFFQPHNLLQIFGNKLRFGRLARVMFSCFSLRQCAQVCAYASAGPYASPV